MQEINLIFGARNCEFRITPIMLNGRKKTSNQRSFLYKLFIRLDGFQNFSSSFFNVSLTIKFHPRLLRRIIN